MRRAPSLALLLLASACTGPDKGDDSVAADPGVDVLGGNTHSLDAVLSEVIADESDGLDVPRDLEFHFSDTDELWVINRGGPSVSILGSPGSADASSYVAYEETAQHFMSEPSALAFGDNGFFATSHESPDGTPFTGGAPDDFMGPTLWIAESQGFDAGHASHYDMLHNSPAAVGIAWETENVYWVFDGYHGALSRYDFGGDHGAGGSDHSDSEMYRYVDGELGYTPDVVSHIVYDADSGSLFVAETASGDIKVLDTLSGEPGGRIGPNYDGGVQRHMDDAALTTLVTGAEAELESPSGMERWGDLLFVADNATGRITAFDLSGERVDWLDTGLPAGALMGIAFDAEGRLYLTDAVNDQIHRITAQN